MAALCGLRNLGKINQSRLFSTFSLKNALLLKPGAQDVALSRWMSGGHHRTLEKLPSNFEWRQYKDHLDFYCLTCMKRSMDSMQAVQCLITRLTGEHTIHLVARLDGLGRAELADIPEDYEPKHWEYFKHPISRFLARHFIDSPEKVYERHMHFLALRNDKIQMRKLEEKVKMLVEQEGRHDSKYWYYIPVNEQATIGGHESAEKQVVTEGFR